MGVSSLAQLTLSLIAIVALIIAISWILKRLKIAGPRGRGDIAVLDQLALGPRDRILLIRVGDAQVLVGVGAGGVVGLTPLAAPITTAGTGTVARVPAFADRMRELLKRNGTSA
jgi:flagellar protein FliO/FliZ